jgi:hypothetical protein
MAQLEDREVRLARPSVGNGTGMPPRGRLPGGLGAGSAGSALQIRRTRESRTSIERAEIALIFRFANGLALRFRNHQGLSRISRSGHLYKTVVMAIRSRQFDVEVVPVWESLDGLGRNDHIFWHPRHLDPTLLEYESLALEHSATLL